MPYITDREKQRLSGVALPETAGELTYCITDTLRRFLEQSFMRRGRLCYEDLATVLGAIEGAKLDFIERIVHPYEARKLIENGDVWPDEFVT